MNINISRALGLGICIFLSLFTVPGCGNALPQETLDEAGSAVKTALESWKKGGSPNQLKELNPPIQFVDADWKNGYKLVSFEISKTDGKVSELPHCWVKLTMKNRSGKTVEKNIVYELKMDPTIVIARDPYK